MLKPTKRGARVMLDYDVLVFLALLAGEEGRSRSWLINYIIRYYAQQLATREKDAAQKLNHTIPF